MNWRLVFRPEVEQDVTQAAAWYEARQSGLGGEFVEEVIRVWDWLATDPLLNARHDPAKNVRWRFTDRFPYRVLYEAFEVERTVVVVAVLHAARHDRHWRKRL